MIITVSVRSSAALRVTVMIMSGSLNPAPHIVRRPLQVPAPAVEHTRFRDRTGGDERRAREQPAPLIDTNLAQRISPAHRQLHAQRGNDVLDDRPADEDGSA